MKIINRLLNKSLHFYRLDEERTLRIELNAFEAFGFDWKRYGFKVAWHNFMWVFKP